VVTSAATFTLSAPTATPVPAVPAAESVAVGTRGGSPYVALGDSYASGAGPAGVKDAKCDCTSGSYPSLIAKLRSVTGARATTRDFWNSRGSILPQIDALTPDTGLVTLTLGGNDVGFSGVLADIRRRSPHAKVIVVGYPALFPDDGVACPEVPFAKGDFACLRDTTTKADRALERQAVAAGAGTSFADTYTPTIGHDMCRPRDGRWIESLTPAPNTMAAHANTLGQSVMAASALWQIYQPFHRP